MKLIKLFPVIIILFFTSKTKSQTCSPNFIYTIGAGGVVTFSNTSVSSNPTLSSTYFWSTGNGLTYTTTSLSQTISTTYTSNSAYTVYLSMQTSTICNNVTVQVINFTLAGCPLSASIALPATNLTSASVSFSSASTGTLSSTSYTWSFGDGTTSNAVNPTHIYAGNGMYGYSLTASNNATCSSFFNVDFASAYNGPTHICSYTPSISYTLGAPGVVTFTANGVGNFPGNQGYTGWDFGDHTLMAGYNSGFNPSHVYFNGVYTPTLHTDFHGQCGPATNHTIGPISVTNNSCHTSAAFTYTVGSGGAVQFTKTSPSTNTNTAYLWNFGDGLVSSQLNPNHTYASAGNYSVSLRSYDLAYPMLPWGYGLAGDTFLVSLPCRKFNRINLNVSGIPCIANSNFTLTAAGSHYYYLKMQYPYNVTAFSWNWGDGTVTNSASYLNSHTYAAAGTYDICMTVTTSCGNTSTSCMTQYLSKGTTGDMVYVSTQEPELTTGIEENQIEKLEMSLYPNPTKDGIVNIRLNQELSIRKIEVYDLFGNVLYQNTSSQNNSLIKIELPDLSTGIYFIRAYSPSNTLTSKFIIEK